VRLELVAVEPVTAWAGADRVAQVIDNLVSNALHHAPGSTRIVVRVGRSGGFAELRVTDDGPGMTEEQKERAFDRFWRAGSGTPGSGLGLAITRRLVEVDGGTVELRDRPEGGLDVVVRLPAP
jgi:signal transduction histidine kinase